MQGVVVEAKSKEEAIKKAAEELNACEKEIIYSIKEEKEKLFKGKLIKLQATTLSEVKKDLNQFLVNIIENLGLRVSIDSKIEDRRINVNMTSDNNQILIGRNGQTLKSIEILSKQYLLKQYNFPILINLDVEDYKKQKVKKLENLSKKLAKEVIITKIEVTLDNMNSFERRVIHNTLTDVKGVTTISEGEEPNRHVIIKPTNF